MNKFEIKALGLEEMSANEQVKTEGGSITGAIIVGIVLGTATVAIIRGCYAYKAIKENVARKENAYAQMGF